MRFRYTLIEVDELAELLSWTSQEMTKYDPDAHPDHNRWSWHGDGHGPALRQEFVSQAKLMLSEKSIYDLTHQRLADNIRQAFEASGISQQELGKRLRLEQSIVSRILSGVRSVTPKELIAICEALQVKVSEVVG